MSARHPTSLERDYRKARDQDIPRLYDLASRNRITTTGEDIPTSGFGVAASTGPAPVSDIDLTDIASHLIPRDASTYDLGTASKLWRRLHVQSASAGVYHHRGPVVNDSPLAGDVWRTNAGILHKATLAPHYTATELANNLDRIPYDLGTSGLRWGTLWAHDINLTGNLSVAGRTFLGSLTGSLTPDATNAIDLGSGSRLWRAAYISEANVFYLHLNRASRSGNEDGEMWYDGTTIRARVSSSRPNVDVLASGGSTSIPWTDVPSDIDPDANASRDLGNPNRQWDEVWARTIHAATEINANIVKLTDRSRDATTAGEIWHRSTFSANGDSVFIRAGWRQSGASGYRTVNLDVADAVGNVVPKRNSSYSISSTTTRLTLGNPTTIWWELFVREANVFGIRFFSTTNSVHTSTNGQMWMSGSTLYIRLGGARYRFNLTRA